MALTYGFNRLGWSSDNIKWEEKYKKLSKDDKDFYHNGLPWVMMATNVGHISKETIPVIVARHKLSPVLTGEWKEKVEDEKYLKKFIGYETNVETEPRIAFLNRIGRMCLENDKLTTRHKIEREFVRYVKEVHRRNLDKEYPSLHEHRDTKEQLEYRLKVFMGNQKTFDVISFRNWRDKEEYLILIRPTKV